ncbi:MAG: hypothetical protein ABIJ08_01625 [Nanoarchaeota archaeon]
MSRRNYTPMRLNNLMAIVLGDNRQIVDDDSLMKLIGDAELGSLGNYESNVFRAQYLTPFNIIIVDTKGKTAVPYVFSALHDSGVKDYAAMSLDQGIVQIENQIKTPETMLVAGRRTRALKDDKGCLGLISVGNIEYLAKKMPCDMLVSLSMDEMLKNGGLVMTPEPQELVHILMYRGTFLTSVFVPTAKPVNYVAPAAEVKLQ